MSNGSRRGFLNDVDRILSDLRHLDLSGSVEYEMPKWPVARGGYGDVFRGSYRRSDGSETKVAIKRLLVYLDGSRDTTRIFKREIQAWSRLSHPNVLPLLGYILEETDSHVSFPLISEWMANGNILDFVIGNPDCDILQLSSDMANGLAYLHGRNIVHSDLKSANVLVSGAQRAIICDFGSSHITHSLHSSSISSSVTGLRGTARWLACELLVEPEKYPRATKASDTWAFGMTVYELLTRGCPYPDKISEPQVISSIMNRRLPQIADAIGEGRRKFLWGVCTLCWDWEPSQRPTMSEVTNRFRDYAQAEQAFPRRQFNAPIIRGDVAILTTVVLKEHDDEVWNVKWSHNGQYLASASRDKSAFIWLIGNGTEATIRKCTLERKLCDHIGPVTCLAWSPDDSVLLTSAESNIKVWNAKSGLCLHELDSHEETVTALEYLPDGSGFLSAGLDRKIILWGADGSTQNLWIESSGLVMDLAVTPNLSRLVVLGFNFQPKNPPIRPQGSREQRIVLFNYASRVQEASMRLESELSSVAISRDSRYALINQAPDHVQLWDLHSARMVRKFTGQQQRYHVIRSCFGGVNDSFIASGSEDGKVYVWDRHTGELLAALTGHGSGSVNTTAWCPTNERMFASCSDDGTVRIWEIPLKPPLSERPYTSEPQDAA